MYPRLIALLLIAGSLAAAATGASAPSEPAIVSAGAQGIAILVPGQPASVAAEATAPATVLEVVDLHHVQEEKVRLHLADDARRRGREEGVPEDDVLEHGRFGGHSHTLEEPGRRGRQL